jgi:hypothetical protein
MAAVGRSYKILSSCLHELMRTEIVLPRVSAPLLLSLRNRCRCRRAAAPTSAPGLTTSARQRQHVSACFRADVTSSLICFYV